MKLRHILKMVFTTRKCGDYKDVEKLKNEKGNFKYNIHDIKSKKKYAKKFLDLHFIFKYRILVPAIYFVDTYFGYMKIKKVPNTQHNYLVKHFDTAFEKALREWTKYYIHNGNLNGKSKQTITKANNSNSVKRLRSMKGWYISMILMDQAYKEFHNMLMFNIAKEMNKEFKGENANHLIYNSKVVDEVNYFNMFKYVKEEIKIGKHNQNEK